MQHIGKPFEASKALQHEQANGIAAFVLPHFSAGTEQEFHNLNSALESLRAQTDDNWRAILVDDNSTAPHVRQHLSRCASELEGRLQVVYSSTNRGPGHARNVGIAKALEAGHPYVLFLDSDDVAHPRRVEVTRQLFSRHAEVGVIYSTFEIIDDFGHPVPRERLTPSIVEILEAHESNPPQGDDVWIAIATETGYVNLTSATAVRTHIAARCPFPCERVSEDFCAWLAYSAAGARYLYTPDIPAKYRIPQNVEGSASRDREGGAHQFNIKKSKVDVNGFESALVMALERGALSEEQARALRVRFFLRRAASMAKDGEWALAEDFRRRASVADGALSSKRTQ
jgi:glycosyltransferase involved in cell wall biosynthesis